MEPGERLWINRDRINTSRGIFAEAVSVFIWSDSAWGPEPAWNDSWETKPKKLPWTWHLSRSVSLSVSLVRCPSG